MMVAIESDMVVMRPQEALVTVSARQRRVTSQPIDAEVLDALPTPLLVLDRHRVVERANAAALALLGEEVIGVYWDPSPAAQEERNLNGTRLPERLRKSTRRKAAPWRESHGS